LRSLQSVGDNLRQQHTNAERAALNNVGQSSN
jgi:hypothetical protein